MKVLLPCLVVLLTACSAFTTPVVMSTPATATVAIPTATVITPTVLPTISPTPDLYYSWSNAYLRSRA